MPYTTFQLPHSAPEEDFWPSDFCEHPQDNVQFAYSYANDWCMSWHWSPGFLTLGSIISTHSCLKDTGLFNPLMHTLPLTHLTETSPLNTFVGNVAFNKSCSKHDCLSEGKMFQIAFLVVTVELPFKLWVLRISRHYYSHTLVLCFTLLRSG